jgi:hypothetical protein
MRSARSLDVADQLFDVPPRGVDFRRALLADRLRRGQLVG